MTNVDKVLYTAKVNTTGGVLRRRDGDSSLQNENRHPG
jgi:hypothetical protein